MPIDDVVFADFTFPPSVNSTLNDPDDDNDWGDFLHSSNPIASLSDHPNISTSSWENPLPLSIFGLEEEGEKSHSTMGSDSQRFDFVDKSKNVASKNLIADMCGFDENNNKGNVNGLNLELNNGLDLDALSSNRNGLNQDSKVLAFDPLSSNGNGVKLDAKVGPLESSSLNQNGFNFQLESDTLSSNVLAFDSLSLNGVGLKDIKAENLDSSSLSRNELNLDSKVPTLVVEDKSLCTSTAAASSGLDFNNGGFGYDDDEDDGWEFQGAGCISSDETFKIGQSNNENGSASKIPEPNSLWNIPNSDKLVTSASANENCSDAQQVNSNLPDKNEEFWGHGKWEFMHAEAQSITELGNAKDDVKRQETSCSSIFEIGFGSNAREVGDLFGMSLDATQKPNEQDFAVDFKPSLLTENSSLSNIYSTTKVNDTGNEALADGKSGNDENSWAFKGAFSEIESKENDNDLSVDGKSDDDENSWAFKDAFSEIGLNDKPHDTEISSAAHPSHGEVQENKIRSDNHKGALPLSIFGDEEEADDPVVFQDISMQMPNFSHADGRKSRHVNIPISDLLLSLYGQVEKNSSFNHAQNSGEEGLGSTNTTMPSDVQIAANDFDDDSWDFKYASSQLLVNDTVKSFDMNNHVTDLLSSLYGQAVENTSSHTKSSSENGLLSFNTVSNPNLPNGGDTFGDNLWDFKHSLPEANINEDFDGDTWEFQDASSGIESDDQTGTFDAVRPTEVDKIDYLDFFSKLKGELHLVALNHLGNLKKAQSDAAVTGEDSRLEALNKEVQDLENVLYQDGLISSELQSDCSSSRNISLVEFVEVLKEPKHQLFESDYPLSKKLTQAEDSPTLVKELLKYVDSTVILALLSVEKQSSFVLTWSKILSICTQELKHGALIWNQALQRNVQEEILSVSQGKRQMIALGEIFRVVELLGCSIRLYKQWILASSVDAAEIMSLLSECSMLWSSSGLKEALGSISDLDDFEYDGSPGTLIESIQHIHDLDVFTLYDHAFSGQDTICHLSLLKPGIVPGMKTVVWNGELYFLPLANLWANLISPDAPSLPSIHVR